MWPMFIDIVSVFPEYFAVANLSLMGKAQSKGLLDIRVHNLRDWTHDVHHSVDDTPVGGGAGMVMKPEVWGECLDELLGLEPKSLADEWFTGRLVSLEDEEDGAEETAANDDDADRLPGADGTADDDTSGEKDGDASTTTAESERDDASPEGTSSPDADADDDLLPGTVLIFPNPSAPLFTQKDATELSRKDRLVFGCGRYEGYDARIPGYYRALGVDVREYSIGDYVLNGGEVAALVMMEAITRLLPGFMGNPESIVEESYTGGEALLEYPQYTRPTAWRGIGVPQVLTSGDHGKVDQFRRGTAIRRTNQIRPDLIAALDCPALDKADRKLLMALGWDVSGAHPRRH